MPKPRKNEKRSDYISRFITDDRMEEKYPDRKQRLAIAYSEWRKHRKNK